MCLSLWQVDFKASVIGLVEGVHSGLDSHCHRRGKELSTLGPPIQVHRMYKLQTDTQYMVVRRHLFLSCLRENFGILCSAVGVAMGRSRVT